MNQLGLHAHGADFGEDTRESRINQGTGLTKEQEEFLIEEGLFTHESLAETKAATGRGDLAESERRTRPEGVNASELRPRSPCDFTSLSTKLTPGASEAISSRSSPTVLCTIQHGNSLTPQIAPFCHTAPRLRPRCETTCIRPAFWGLNPAARRENEWPANDAQTVANSRR